MDSNECDIIRPCFRSGALHVFVAFVTNDKVSLMSIEARDVRVRIEKQGTILSDHVGEYLEKP
jgi:hypothetical protein